MEVGSARRICLPALPGLLRTKCGVIRMDGRSLMYSEAKELSGAKNGVRSFP